MPDETHGRIEDVLDLESGVSADDDVRLWRVRSGSPCDLSFVLCHGGPGLWDELKPVAAMVEDLAEVIRWDQRGGGRSDRSGPYSIARFVADLECLRHAHGVERWVVGGHSWGAGLALRYALEHPDRVLGLVYLSGTDLGWPQHRDRYRSERLRRLGRHRYHWQALRDRRQRDPAEEHDLRALTFSTDFANRSRALQLAERWGYDRFEINMEANAAINAEIEAEHEEELRQRCEGLAVPVLVVHGDADPRPVAGPEALVRALPQARLALLSDVGHIPWAEHPEQLRAHLRSFLLAIQTDATRSAGAATELEA